MGRNMHLAGLPAVERLAILAALINIKINDAIAKCVYTAVSGKEHCDTGKDNRGGYSAYSGVCRNIFFYITICVEKYPI